MIVCAVSFQLITAFLGASTTATGAEVASGVGSALGSAVGIADSEAAGVGAASSLPLSGRVTTTTARRIIPTMIAPSTFPEAPCLGADAGVEGFVGSLCETVFGVDETSTRAAPSDDAEGTGGITTEEADVARFFAADFFTVFFAALFFTADFFTVFFAAVFFAALFFTADFLTVFFATAFFAVDFLATDFFAALFFTAAFLAAGFFFTATITPCFG